MKTLIIASQNPVKIRAVTQAFQAMFPDEIFSIQTVSVSSDVSYQPRTDLETVTGAANRARHAAELLPQADYWVGIEGGVADEGNEMAAFAWVYILNANQTGKSRTGTFFLPAAVAELVRQGEELGQADDIVFRTLNSKQENGAVGLLTGNLIDRVKLYEQAVLLALIPFRNLGLYPPQTMLE
jgi:inosine/xanthosine triphosphatase